LTSSIDFSEFSLNSSGSADETFVTSGSLKQPGQLPEPLEALTVSLGKTVVFRQNRVFRQK
jgi:hypothetical protein